MPIRPLPALLVNQIAAGEVIERPASVVRELVENAIDAGAGRIDVTLENGGRDLVRVADDGAGIPPAELTLAVAPHATSKIADQDDLAAIATMGFRGEALASIASVSRLSLESRTGERDAAARIDVEAGRIDGPRPAPGPRGTIVTVRNLFFNTPARRKFLRTDQTEASRAADTVETLAISHPAVAFSLTVDGRRRLELPPDQAPARRVLSVLGAELADELLELDVPDAGGGLGLWGLLGRPGIARGTARHLKIYLNGRPIADRTVNHAIREAYRGLIAPDRHPTAVLMMRLDPARVDVNVHPAKAEVRFRDQSLVHRAVCDAVRAVLRAADLVPAVDLGRSAGGAGTPSAVIGTRPAPAGRFERDRAPFGSGARGFSLTEMKAALGGDGDGAGAAPGSGTAAGVAAAPPILADTLVVRDRYVVTGDEDGLLIIDQHALHERVMFEKLRARLGSGGLEAQRLLMPATLDVDPSRLEQLEALRPLLERLGIEAEPLGPRSVAVHAFTSLLFERRVDPVAFMRELLDRAEQYAGAEPEAALHEVLDMMACKAAVKSGDRLSARELVELLAAREDVERSSRCPHGRPTTLRLTIADLDRQFGR